ncbi:hypothetical protein [Methanobacterium aggregans]|nr:hypothetical protein [Methanobacterium aggregans]
MTVASEATGWMDPFKETNALSNEFQNGGVAAARIVLLLKI